LLFIYFVVSFVVSYIFNHPGCSFGCNSFCYFSFFPLLALLSAPCGFRWSQNLITFKNFKLFQNSIYGIFHLFTFSWCAWDRHTVLFQKITYYNNNNRNASGSNPAVRQVAHPQKCTNISSIAFVSLLQIDLILYKPTSLLSTFRFADRCLIGPPSPPGNVIIFKPLSLIWLECALQFKHLRQTFLFTTNISLFTKNPSTIRRLFLEVPLFLFLLLLFQCFLSANTILHNLNTTSTIFENITDAVIQCSSFCCLLLYLFCRQVCKITFSILFFNENQKTAFILL